MEIIRELLKSDTMVSSFHIAYLFYFILFFVSRGEKRHINSLGPRTWDNQLYGTLFTSHHNVSQITTSISHDAGTDRKTLFPFLRLYGGPGKTILKYATMA